MTAGTDTVLDKPLFMSALVYAINRQPEDSPNRTALMALLRQIEGTDKILLLRDVASQ